MKKVTIQDIADALGVSRNTVSKAINNSEGLADATRERIIQKAIEMGYKQFSYVKSMAPFSGDGSLLSSKAPSYRGEIALFTTTFFSLSHFASLMLDKFQQEISQLGYSLNIHRIDDSNLTNLTPPITFHKDRANAVICFEMFDIQYGEMLCSLGLPVLFVDGPNKRSGFSLPADQLYMDNTTEITKLINLALEKGIRRIGFIGNYEHCQSFLERYIAYRSSMGMAGLPIHESDIVNSQNVEEMEIMLRETDKLPELFICANDFVAIDAIRILRRLGISIPEDVMICGFDDSPESRIFTPSLTTIHIHTQVMAFAAVDLLISRMKEPSLDYRTIHTQTDLILRDSTPF